MIESGELDLDAPLLPSCAPSASTLYHHADGQPPVESWRKVFESMDRALTLEGQKLVSLSAVIICTFSLLVVLLLTALSDELSIF